MMELDLEDEISDSMVGSEYVLVGIVQSSSISRVWKGVNRLSGEQVAVKQVYLSKLNTNLKDCLHCELNFLSTVSHPNIIRLIHVIQDEGCMFMVFEFCAGGNLASYIQHHGPVQEQIAKRITLQLGAGLKVLHLHHIIHRDLKPEFTRLPSDWLDGMDCMILFQNILLSTADNDAVIKIADFGLAGIVYPGNYAETVCGSPMYMAPELLQFHRYDEKVDMWSLGAIIFELLNGYPPFRGRNNVQLLRHIKKCTSLPFSEDILARLHPDCVDMCTKLLCANPGIRMTFDEFYLHKFLKT